MMRKKEIRRCEKILRFEIKNFKRINATVIVGQAGTARSMLEAIETAINPIVSPLGVPFVVIEDDIEVKRWDPIIHVPENADAYLAFWSGGNEWSLWTFRSVGMFTLACYKFIICGWTCCTYQ